MEDKKYTCSDMPKLCSCPFCGSENITIRYGVFGYPSDIYYPNETGFVACLKCGIRSSKTGRAKNAVKKWNARKESNSAAPKWISVEERLPGDPLDGSGEVVELLIEKHGTVLEVLPGYYDHHTKDWLVYLGGPTGEYLRDQPGWWDVIKWRQMPEPPEEE